jgi:O-antigen ligase
MTGTIDSDRVRPPTLGLEPASSRRPLRLPELTLSPALWLLLAAALPLPAVVAGVLVARYDVLTVPFLAVVGLLLATSAVLLFARYFWICLLLVLVARPALDYFKDGYQSSVTDPSVLVGILFTSAASWWLYRRMRTVGLQCSLACSAFIGLGVVAVISSLTAAHPVDSVQASVRLLSSVVMLACLEQLLRERPERIQPLLVAVFASLIIPALVAVTQFSNPPEVPTYGPAVEVGRVQGTFFHPNAFATYLTTLIPLALALLPYVKGLQRWAVLAVAGSSALFLLFTYARGAWVAAFLAIVVVGWLQDRRIIALAVLAILLVVLFVPSVVTRLSDLTAEQGPIAYDTNSLTWRTSYWGHLVPMTLEGPVTGIGLGMVEQRTVQGVPPHNVFVQALVETGVAGLLSLLVVIAAIGHSIAQRLRQVTGGIERGITVGSAAVAVGFLVQCFSENLFNQVISHWYFLVPVALATSQARPALVTARARARAGSERDGSGPSADGRARLVPAP